MKPENGKSEKSSVQCCKRYLRLPVWLMRVWNYLAKLRQSFL